MDKQAGKGKIQAPDPVMARMVKDERYGKLMVAIDTTRGHLDAMKEGEKTNLKELAEKVAKDLDVSVTQVNPFVHMAVQTYDGITVSRGRYGGIFKGIKTKKEDHRSRCETCGQVIRQKKSKEKDDTSLNAASTDADDDDEDDDFDEDEDEDDEDELENSETIVGN